jgi:hypothetical protein
MHICDRIESTDDDDDDDGAYRGPGASEAWECLEDLQTLVPPGSEVIRLVGNHGESVMSW